jgi:AraC family transcriptional regulator of adaptative response/methylated-DNA-[protein]-cysteine methyltransferase
MPTIHAIQNTPLGELLVAATDKGICAVRPGSGPRLAARTGSPRRSASPEPPGTLRRRAKASPREARWVKALADYLAGRKPWPLLPYDVQGTAFQRKVWAWLRTIPSGTTYSYAEAAKAIGRPRAARAVARACASNPVGLVVPCHRIVPKAGGVGGFGWGPERKRRLLRLEGAAA